MAMFQGAFLKVCVEDGPSMASDRAPWRTSHGRASLCVIARTGSVTRRVALTPRGRSKNRCATPGTARCSNSSARTFRTPVVNRLIATMLFGVGRTAALTYGVVWLLLGSVAVLASYVPARRAARIDPIAALKES